MPPTPRTCGRGSAPTTSVLRSEIERYGGTVEKFVGDAVMAVFGAPVAHEDDAERAVRAGLRILEAIAELNERGSAAGAPGADRDRHRRGGRRVGRPSRRGGGDRHRRRRQHRLAPAGSSTGGRDRGLGADVPADGARLRLRGARAGAGEGQGGAARALAAAPCPRPLRLGRHPYAHCAARRPGAGEDASGRDVRAFRAAALGASW